MLELRIVYEKCAYSLYAGDYYIDNFSRSGLPKAESCARMLQKTLATVGINSKITVNIENFVNRRKYPPRRRNNLNGISRNEENNNFN